MDKSKSRKVNGVVKAWLKLKNAETKVTVLRNDYILRVGKLNGGQKAETERILLEMSRQNYV